MLNLHENDLQLEAMCRTIKRLRIQNEMTIAELAERSSLPFGMLCAIEEHQVSDGFTVDMLLTLCILFHIHLADFFRITEN